MHLSLQILEILEMKNVCSAFLGCESTNPQTSPSHVQVAPKHGPTLPQINLSPFQG